MKRLKDEAREDRRLIDATHGRRTRSIIVLDSNHVVLSAIQAETISQRFALLREAGEGKRRTRDSVPTDPATAPARRGTLFILSAPSGAGKTTLRRAVLAAFRTCATPSPSPPGPPRPGEVNGRDYVFVSRAEFEAGIRDGRWAEWAQVHGNYYGTSAGRCGQSADAGTRRPAGHRRPGRAADLRPLSGKRHDLHHAALPGGAAAAAHAAGHGPPGGRSQVRLCNARREMEQRHWYRHVVVNDDLETAIAELIHLIASYR